MEAVPKPPYRPPGKRYAERSRDNKILKRAKRLNKGIPKSKETLG